MVNRIKKDKFLRDVLVLANAVELIRSSTTKVSPAVCLGDTKEDTSFNDSIANWETFSNIAKKIKE